MTAPTDREPWVFGQEPIAYLTAEGVVRVIDDVVDKVGDDHVTRAREPGDRGTALYHADGMPRCLVGHIRHHLGASPLVRMSLSGEVILRSGLGFSLGREGVDRVGYHDLLASPDACTILVGVVDANDSGLPWGQIRNMVHQLHQLRFAVQRSGESKTEATQ